MIFSAFVSLLAAASAAVALPSKMQGLDDAMVEKVKANMIEISTHRCVSFHCACLVCVSD